MVSNTVQGGRLYELYARYVGEPQSRTDVYGYWLFVGGSVISFIGVLVYVLGSTSPSVDGFLVRKISIALAAFGLPVGLFGILLLLPIKRRSVQIASVGASTAVFAVGWFVTVYPYNWVVGTPDYSTSVITVYTVGMAVVVGVAALVPIVTGEKSFFFEEEYTREGEYPGIMVGESRHGGLFAVYRDGKEWAWRLIGQDAIAAGASTFLSRLETEETVERVQEKVSEAGLLEIKNAAFRLYEADEERWKWLLMREDGSVVADSGDGFDTRDAAAESVNDLKEFGPAATVLDIEGAAFDCYADQGHWHWRLVDDDRSVLAEGNAKYETREAAEAATDAIRSRVDGAGTLAIEDFGVELLEADDQWEWRILDVDGADHATSSIGFSSRRAAESAVYELLDHIGDAPILEADEPTYEVVPTDSDTWHWRFVDDDQVVARGHDDSPDEAAAVDGAELVGEHAADADIVVIDDAEFEYYQSYGAWRWRLVTEDREVIAESAGSYSTQDKVAQSIEEVSVQAGEADLIEFERAAFQLYETDDEWRWRLIDEDGNVLADSGEEHGSRDEAAASMMTLKENAPDAELLEIETAAFELFNDEVDEWNWRLVDEGGRTTARGAKYYSSKEDAREAMTRLVDRAPETQSREMDEAAFQLYADDDDEWNWRLVHPDGKILADGTTSYSTRDAAETAVDGDIREAADAGTVHSIEGAAIQLVDRVDSWSWRLLDRDRETVAAGASTAPTREAVVDAVSTLRQHAEEAPVFELADATIVLYTVDDGWRWQLVESDWTTLMQGTDSYDERADAEAATERITALVPEADTLEYDQAAFELFEADGRWHWRLVDDQETVVAASAEGYDSRAAVTAALDDIKDEVEDASILEVETAAFELHENDGAWRWQLIDQNGTELAKSLTSYPTRREAREEMNNIKEFTPTAMTQVVE